MSEMKLPPEDQAALTIPRVQSTPHGVISAVQKMIELLELPPGWNSYNAKPITKENVNFAISLLGRTMHADTPAPNKEKVRDER